MHLLAQAIAAVEHGADQSITEIVEQTNAIVTVLHRQLDQQDAELTALRHSSAAELVRLRGRVQQASVESA